MDKFEAVEALIQEITEEAANFKNATDSNEEVEALKDLLDVLVRGSKQVLEKIDQYNDRRYRSTPANIDLVRPAKRSNHLCLLPPSDYSDGALRQR